VDLVQKRKQLRQRQVDKVKKFRQSNMSTSVAVQKQKERDEMKKEVRKEIEKETQKESMNIQNSDGTTFARVMDIIGPTNMKPVVSGGLWKGTEQISEKKSDCECDGCGQDPCIECGESHHSVKKESISYGSRTAREGDNEAAAAARKRIYDRASAKDKDHMDAREIANQRNKERDKKLITKEAKEEANRSDYGKASVRNKRKFGKEGEPAIFDTNSERGKMIDQRRAEHKTKRSVKTKGVSEAVGAVLGAIGGGAIAAAGGVAGGAIKAGGSIAGGAIKAGGSIAGAARDAAGKQKAAATRNKARQKKAEVDAANIESGNMESYDWKSDKSMRINKIAEGSLHKWFKGSKSKDGKPGWVNVKTGGTCASDEPGEGTPKCVSSSKRASMTKAERDSASRRKKAADPGQQSKSGAAKPTYVSTDKPKKKINEKCWDGYTQKGMKKKGKKVVPNCVKEEDVKGKGSGKKDACYKKVKASAKVWPSAYASGRLVQCRKKGAANYGKSKSESYSWRDELDFVQEGAAWTKKAGKNKEGGLNEKGRKSYERENPGSDLKAPQPEGGSRKKSFCARMGGMKKKLTSSKTANDPDSRINKALRKWKC